MKQHQFLCVLIVCAVLLAPRPVALAAEKAAISWHTDIKQAWKTTQASQRPILLFFTMPGCSYCSKMKRTYNDARIASEVRSSYVPVAVDSDQAEKFIDKLKISIYPTTVIISPQAKIIGYIRGYVTPDEMRQRLGTVARRQQANKTTR